MAQYDDLFLNELQLKNLFRYSTSSQVNS